MAEAFNITWDSTGEHLYETGVDRGVVYPQSSSGYGDGEAWSGLTNVTLSPSGAEASPFYADNIKYLNLMSNEDMAYTIEAYMYPDAFAECNGEKELAPGVKVGQQTRKPFGFTYRNILGNDTVGNDYGYVIHLLYGGLAAPSERTHSTVNDSPEPSTMSWEVSTTPVKVTGAKPTAHLEINSTTVKPEKLAAFEAIIYGTAEVKARLPLPDEVAELFKTEEAAG